MAWFSLLPESLSAVEGWIKSFFIFMALFTIGPWALFFIYDIILYIWRAIAYEVPLVGGRATGRQRPRAPTLTERPDGETRNLGLIKIPTLDRDAGEQMETQEMGSNEIRQRQSRTSDD
ncbi:hypothetical protein Vi05172_g989 [Venturia inaequalis]|uniref:Uncharacterized protein n=1 Tax=Venturia inaequalis TaxID=5025 RepID=A0A8H3VJT1_VENIN|nr:hypothetical protein EG327_003253 [Venturia inaequalis]RDI88589.1 hypothetical protein Vi05172_g989 [Venturia inaequalis]